MSLQSKAGAAKQHEDAAKAAKEEVQRLQQQLKEKEEQLQEKEDQLQEKEAQLRKKDEELEKQQEQEGSEQQQTQTAVPVLPAETAGRLHVLNTAGLQCHAVKDQEVSQWLFFRPQADV